MGRRSGRGSGGDAARLPLAEIPQHWRVCTNFVFFAKGLGVRGVRRSDGFSVAQFTRCGVGVRTPHIVIVLRDQFRAHSRASAVDAVKNCGLTEIERDISVRPVANDYAIGGLGPRSLHGRTVCTAHTRNYVDSGGSHVRRS